MKAFKDSLKRLRLSRSFSTQKATEREPLIDKNEKRAAYLQAFPKVLVYNGYELPGDLIHSKVLDDIQDFEVRESDVFIVSYPQSGSSAAEDIVSQIVDKLREKQPSRRVRNKTQAARLEADNPYGHLRWLKGMKAPRILTTNLPLPLLPQDVKNPKCKIIYLVRNPKDQSVSNYYHHRVKGILSSLDDFFELYLSGHLLYGDYFSHVIDFWQLYRKHPKNVLFISFEELKLETLEMIKLIVQFLEYELTDEDIIDLPINLPKFPSKSQDLSGIPSNSIKQFHFEGVIGDWLSYYSPEQSRKIDEIVKNRFESIGLSLCFDPIEAVKRLTKLKRIIVDTKGDKNNNKSQSEKKVVYERPKLDKEEYLLLRNQSLSKIDIVDVDHNSRSGDKSACCFAMCCPCVFWKTNFTNV